MAMRRTKKGMLSHRYDKDAKVHYLTSNYPLYSSKNSPIMYFVPTADFNSDDTFKLNNAAYSACMYNGADLTSGFFTAFKSADSTMKNIIEVRIVHDEKTLYMNKLSTDELCELLLTGNNETVTLNDTTYTEIISFDFIAAPCSGTNTAIATFNAIFDNTARSTSYLDTEIWVGDERQPFTPKVSFGAIDSSVTMHFLVPLILNNVGRVKVRIMAKTPAPEVNVTINTSKASLVVKGLNLYDIN